MCVYIRITYITMYVVIICGYIFCIIILFSWLKYFTTEVNYVLTTSVFSEKTLSKSASGASHFTGKGLE